MSRKARWQRFGLGFLCALTALIAGFAVILALIPAWGATPAETTRVYPGDDYIPAPAIDWVIARDIDAPAAEVYPWLVQMGDTRAGFYSYMFIEKLIDPRGYNNADRVHPEWQTPAIGEGVIADVVAVAAYEPGDYFLVRETEKLEGMQWTWMWQVKPIDAGHSRLINTMRIGVPAALAGNPVMGFFLNAGGFIMEQNMMQGIVQRAEGRGEFRYIEPLEILLWLAALFAGLWAARSFLSRPAWRLPLAVGLLAIAWIFVLTFVQPAIWLRALGDIFLLAGAYTIHSSLAGVQS